MKVLESPWGRQWRENQKVKVTTNDPVTVILLVAIFFGLVFLFGLQVGLHEGKEKGYKQAKVEIWGNYYADYAKVQWLIEDANLQAMWIKR